MVTQSRVVITHVTHYEQLTMYFTPSSRFGFGGFDVRNIPHGLRVYEPVEGLLLGRSRGRVSSLQGALTW